MSGDAGELHRRVQVILRIKDSAPENYRDDEVVYDISAAYQEAFGPMEHWLTKDKP